LKILIVSTNKNKNPIAVMPFGACLVAEATEKFGHRVKILDLMFSTNYKSDLEKQINLFKPDVIGLSIRNIDNNNFQNTVTYFDELKYLVNLIKKNSKAIIVLGGSAVGIMPEELLRYTDVSLAVTGYGEIVFPKLLEAISENLSLNIQGVAQIESGNFVKNSLSNILVGDNCEVPDFNRWIDVNAYLKKQSSIPVQTKRGCPYNCIYCTYPINEGKTYHLFSPKSVAASVRKLVEKGLNDIEFVDNVFNSPYRHAIDVCNEIRSEKINARFQTMSLNPRFVDDRLLDVMEDIGFSGIGITAESASDKVLKNLGKEYNSAELHEAAISVYKHEVPCFWMFMLGGPGETKETVIETLEFAKNFVRSEDIASFAVGIRIYPGTELAKKAGEDGDLNMYRPELLDPLFYTSQGLDADWAILEVKKYMDDNFNFIDSDSMGLSFLPSIYGLGYKLGVKPPLWKHVSTMRRMSRLVGLNI